MAVLTEQERQEVWVGTMNMFSRSRQSLNITKSELRATIDGLDNYIETNQSAINSAIPQPARAELSSSAKAEIFAYVSLKRYGVI